MTLNITTETISALNKSIANVMILILLPICVYFISDIFWNWHYSDSNPLALPKINVTQSSKKPEQISQAGWDWFQIKETVTKKVASLTKLKAQLKGVIGIGQRGVAFIALDGKKQEPFKVGDMIKEGIVLDRLGIDYVVLLRGEDEELLRIKKINLFTQEPEEIAEEVAEVQKQEISRLAEIIKDEPLKLMDIIKFQQIKVKKYGLGYKVLPRTRQQQATFNALGFKNGDVIFTINNKPVVQLATDPNMVSQLLSADNLDIKLLRGQNIENVSVSLK